MQRTTLQTRDGDSIELRTHYDNKGGRIEGDTLKVDFDGLDVDRWDHGDYATVWLSVGGHIFTRVDMDSHQARRFEVEAARDDTIDHIA